MKKRNRRRRRKKSNKMIWITGIFLGIFVLCIVLYIADSCTDYSEQSRKFSRGNIAFLYGMYL